MSFSDLYKLLAEYSVDKIMLALTAFIGTLLIKKTLLKNKSKRFASLLPFILGVILNLIISFFKRDDGTFGEIFSSGISTGSAGTVIYAFAEGLKGKADYEEVYLDSFLFEGVLAGYVPTENLPAVAERCAVILRTIEGEDEQLTALQKEILEHSSADEAQALLIAKLMRNVLIGADAN